MFLPFLHLRADCCHSHCRRIYQYGKQISCGLARHHRHYAVQARAVPFGGRDAGLLRAYARHAAARGVPARSLRSAAGAGRVSGIKYVPVLTAVGGRQNGNIRKKQKNSQKVLQKTKRCGMISKSRGACAALRPGRGIRFGSSVG